MLRCGIAMPTVFIPLSRLGKKAMFERSWTFGGTLLQSVAAILFTFDMREG